MEEASVLVQLITSGGALTFSVTACYFLWKALQAKEKECREERDALNKRNEENSKYFIEKILSDKVEQRFLVNDFIAFLDKQRRDRTKNKLNEDDEN